MGLRSIYGSKVAFNTDSRSLRSTNLEVSDTVNDDGFRGIVYPGPDTVALFDDFLGDLVADEWNFTEGTDNTTSDGAIVAAAGGTFVLTPGDSAGSVAADGSQLTSELNWQARQNLWFSARVKLASIASVSCFFGLTDTKSLEQPIYSAASANTITTDATDAVGFFFDTAMSTANWWAAGVANNVDATHQNLGVAPVADTYETFSFQLNTLSTNAVNARFYRNGKPVGSIMSNACTYNVPLTPVFIVRPKSAAAGKLLTIDYVNVAGNRI